MDILVAIIFFVLTVLVLSALVLLARYWVIPRGTCAIKVNNDIEIQANIGDRLLSVLNRAEIRVPSSCGGAGTCGLCRAKVISGGGEPSPQESALLSARDLARCERLACQVSVLGPVETEVDNDFLSAVPLMCTVKATRCVSSLIKEIVLSLPEGKILDDVAGKYVQISCPAYRCDFKNIDVAERFRSVWQKLGIDQLVAASKGSVQRAYSLANPPDKDRELFLNIRLALPSPGEVSAPPGIVSSWLFSLQPGDQVEVLGPFGHFQVRDTEREAIFIGGGVGMAPLYAQILDLLIKKNSRRKISYWYGARSKSEVYYDTVFEQMQKTHENFSWNVVYSDSETASDSQTSEVSRTGYVHEVLLNEYLNDHPTPEDCEYYLCGPPLMIKAVRAMLYNLGVESDSIFYDDFGTN